MAVTMGVWVGVALAATGEGLEADSGMDVSPAVALLEPLKGAVKRQSSYN
jgi:hypothetical protein